MKRTIMLILAAILLIAGIGNDLAAQEVRNPNSNPPQYYTYPGSATTYYRSKTDTIWPSGLKIGGTTFLSFKVVNTDSMRTIYYFDWANRGSTQWNNAVYTDSIVASVPDTAEIILRSHAVERLGGFDRVLRVRAAHQSTVGYDSSQTYTPAVIYKP